MNITVAQRLYGLIFISALGLAGVSWLGQNRMDVVYDKTNYANINSVPSIVSLSNAGVSLGRLRVRVYRHVLNTDTSKMAEIENTIKEARDTLSSALKKYETEGMISDDKDRQLLNDDIAAMNDYIPGVEKALTLSRQNMNEQARDTLTQYAAQAEKLNAALSDHMDYNVSLAKKGADAAVETKSSASIMSTSISLVTLAVIVMLGLWIVRNLMRQLGGEPNFAAEVANKIAAGDLSTSIEIKANDTGSLLASMKNMMQAIQALVNDANMLAKAAAEGRLQTRADANNHQGEFRKIVQGVNNTLDGVVQPLNEAMEVLTLIENGDLTHTVTGNYQGQLGIFKDTVNNTVAKLAQTITEVMDAANQLSNASEQISATSQSLSQASSEQAASVEETSASIEQMSSSINQNAENAKVTDGMAGKANQEAVEGGVAVKQTVEAMKSIAGKIGIIDDIAYQTNMLALNAAIEAARAGDHGKGFAVVAAEVRKLAERSQIAAQEIGQLAENSVHTAESAGNLLDAIVPSISKTSDLVQEIAAASNEQSAGVNQINTAMAQMNQITQQNASASEELAATAEEMNAQAEQLQTLMSFFKINGYETSVPRIPMKGPGVIHNAKNTLHIRSNADEGKYDLKKFDRF